MASKNLEERLEEVGKNLAPLPDSPENLYTLLDLADNLLSRVEQSPSEAMLTALKPLMDSLVMQDLLRHSDADVKVVIASCISEITRITAPEAPYEDDIMKEIFQMIVGTFEGLHDTSSRSFTKRVSILETVAKVRSCVVMLDLECDDLILDMFQHFLSSIRSNHSENVYFAMETIMTLVIEESEEISSKLLSCLLNVVKKDNKEALPIARKLVEQVMGACDKKLKPYLLEFVKSTGARFSDYTNVVASICQENLNALDNNEANTSGDIVVEDSKLSERTISDEMLQVSTKQEQEVGCLEKVGVLAENSPKVALSNGTVQVENGDAITKPASPQLQHESRNGSSKDAVVVSLADDGNPESLSVPVGVPDLSAKKGRGRRVSKSAQLTDTTDHSRIDNEIDTPAVSGRRKSNKKEDESSRFDDLATKGDALAGSVDPEKTNELQHHSVVENTYPDDASQNPNENLLESARSKKGRPSRRKTAKRNAVDAVADKSASSSARKDSPVNSQTQDETVPSKDNEKEPEDISRSEVKSERRSGKKIQLRVSADEGPEIVTSDTKVKPQRDTGKKGFKRKATEGKFSGKRQNSNIKQKGEVTLQDDVPGEASLKRPETLDGKEEYDDNIVGLRIKVWWPYDRKFYNGVVDSFDPTENIHKVVYTDGDVELLQLTEERWEFVEGGTKIDGSKEKDIQATDASQGVGNKPSRRTPNSLSKQINAHAKSGTESIDKAGTKPRGRSQDGASKLEKSDDRPMISRKSKGKAVAGDKSKTPTSGGKLKSHPEKESMDATPRGKSDKDDASKTNSKTKNAPPVSGRKSKTSKYSSKLSEEIPKPSGKSGEATPRSGSQSESRTKKRNKPDLATPNGESSKDKAAKARDGTLGEKKRRTHN